jgi:hypothetical protein
MKLLPLLLPFMLFSMYMTASEPTKPLLILNMSNEEVLPRHFRTCQSPYSCTLCKKPTREGLDQLLISGSAQFSELSWKAILKAIPHQGPIVNVDLRQETHGFLNGAAISLYATQNWGNLGKTNNQIDKEERAWLKQLKNHKEITLHIVESKGEKNINKTRPITVPVSSVSSEAELMTQFKSDYLRLHISDHQAPRAAEVDKFVQFVRTLPNNTWLHFHCKAGRGRTTTFMAMYDMIRNAKHISFDDIIARQRLLGGADLLSQPLTSSWKYYLEIHRVNFLKDFYEYAKSNLDDFNTPWSLFLKKKNNATKSL